MNKYVCVHAHFYQPPRENPWLEEVELQDSAYPHHDWNARITAECYGPNTASRILRNGKEIIDISNNFSKMSFNIGPTLMSWLERHEPEIYWGIQEGDRKSMERYNGHGAAIAQAYNHIVLPLAHSRDKRTQIIWGIKDFEYRFKRYPEGMWLPETAVDYETLEILAEFGIKFTILAPRQAKRMRKMGDKRWKDVSNARIDPRRGYLCHLPSGKTINLFFYDGPIAQDIAFGSLLDNGEKFAQRLAAAFVPDGGEPQLVHVATDGESYGHHHRHGDMALAYSLYYIESNAVTQLTVYAAYLQKHPAEYEIDIFENSSWSCVHGVERWKSNCGCNSGIHSGWHQEWRAPLRGALDWLRDNLFQIFEEQMKSLVKDPWITRDRYIEVILNRSPEQIDLFLAEHAHKKLSADEITRVLKLLEMQRHAMLMYTSCGWFFDELSGIETIQIIHYAARALQLAKEITGISFEDAFIGLLERAPSNIPEFGNGAKIYELFVKPAMVDLLRVGVHYAISSLFQDYKDTAVVYVYKIVKRTYERQTVGKQKLAIGQVTISSVITQEEKVISFAALHLGDHNIVGGVRDFIGEEAFKTMSEEIKKHFALSEMPEVIRLIDKNFLDHSYSVWHLFKDEQRDIIDQIFDETRQDVEASFKQLYERYYPIMQVVSPLKLKLPGYFSFILDFVLNSAIRKALKSDAINFEELKKLIGDARKWSLDLNKRAISFWASKRIIACMDQWLKSYEDTAPLAEVANIYEVLNGYLEELNVWKAQNILFFGGKKLRASMQQRTDQGDEHARQWIELFNRISGYCNVIVD